MLTRAPLSAFSPTTTKFYVEYLEGDIFMLKYRDSGGIVFQGKIKDIHKYIDLHERGYMK